MGERGEVSPRWALQLRAGSEIPCDLLSLSEVGVANPILRRQVPLVSLDAAQQDLQAKASNLEAEQLVPLHFGNNDIREPLSRCSESV